MKANSGLKPRITKTPKAATHSSKVATSGKSPNAAMSKATTSKPSAKAIKNMAGVRTSGSSPNSQMTKGTTTKVSQKATTRISGNTHVFGD